MRIVSDVNVLVSSTIAPLGIPRRIISAWRQGHIELITSIGILMELEEKLRYSRIRDKYRLTEGQIRTAVAVLRTQSEIVAVPRQAVVAVTGDPEDDYVLTTAAVAQPDYLVTGDRGLLALAAHRGVKIVTPRQFIDLRQWNA